MKDKSIIEYLEEVRKAYANDDREKAEELAEIYGSKTATYKEVEEATAYSIQLLSALLDTNKTIHNFKLDFILDLLVENELVPEESVGDLDKSIKDILEKIEKVASEDE